MPSARHITGVQQNVCLNEFVFKNVPPPPQNSRLCSSLYGHRLPPSKVTPPLNLQSPHPDPGSVHPERAAHGAPDAAGAALGPLSLLSIASAATG